MPAAPTALVTGATAGIGAAFARELARRGHDLVLVARDVQRLERTASELRSAHGVAVEEFVADLADRVALERVRERVADPTAPVDVLVSNAGFGLTARFMDGDLAAEEAMFDVLCRAVLVLSHAAAGAMVPRGRGRIITVSSVAGFLPGGSYSAAKAWATVFTESLAGDLAGTGVTATALCPGYTRTEFHARGGIPTTGIPRFAWLDADAVVRRCLDDVARGRVTSIPGVPYRLAAAALDVAPRVLVRQVARRIYVAGRRRR